MKGPRTPSQNWKKKSLGTYSCQLPISVCTFVCAAALCTNQQFCHHVFLGWNSTKCQIYAEDYKNLSWVWEWDRKICPENHRLALWGLPSDDNQWSLGTDFSIPSAHKLWIFFLAHHFIPHLYWKNLKKTSRKSWISWDATWWRHFNITMMPRIDLRPVWGCSFFIFP